MNIFLQLLEFVAGVGVFLFAMKILSQGLEQSAGSSIRKLFAKISSNRLVGVGVGAGVTVLIQSSSATTVMVLGFVNAGLMNLFQATSIIMGANIGTTLTAILISLKTFAISNVLAAFTAVGAFIVLLAKREKVRAIGSFIAGLGLIFVGLQIMTNGMSFLSSSAAFQGFLAKFNNPLLIVLVGIVFTAAIQSSTAMTGIIITLASLPGGSAITLEAAFYLIMGANVGTCITALLAAIGGEANTKRTALIHLVFNLIGVIIFLPIIAFSKNAITNLFHNMFGSNFAPAIALFHIVLNVVTTLILLPFIRGLVSLAQWVIPKSEEEINSKMRLKYLDERILVTPSLALTQIVRETIEMQQQANINFKLAIEGLLSNDNKDRAEVVRREEHIDFLNHTIADYMVKIGTLNVTSKDEELIAKLFHIISDIERIGDHAYNLSDYTEHMIAEDISFSPEAKDEIKLMSDAVEIMFEQVFSAFSYKSNGHYSAIQEKAQEIEDMKERFTAGHIKRLSTGACLVDSGAIFFSALNDFKRIGDHMINIADRVGQTQDKALKRVLRKIDNREIQSSPNAK